MPNHRQEPRGARPITREEAEDARGGLCHRRLLATPKAGLHDIERLGDDWGGLLVHTSCAVLAGFHAQGSSKSGPSLST